MKIGKPLAMTVAIACCSACEYAPTMLDRTVAYNRAVASSTNQVLLLNVVRASQRLPTYYTRLEGDAASMGLTPNGSISLPLSNPRSFETDVNTGATGGVTGATTKAIGALAGIVTGLGLQASESNLMTLQTLDDQKYQNGMMTPVPLKNIQAFQDEGYQRDLLFMMFLSSVQVSNELIDTIDAASVARCGQALAGGVDRRGFLRAAALRLYRQRALSVPVRSRQNPSRRLFLFAADLSADRRRRGRRRSQRHGAVQQ